MDNIYIKTRELPNWVDEKYFRGTDLASIEDLIGIIEELKDDLDYLQEDYDNYIQYVKDNYKFIDTREAIGYDERTW